MSRLVPRFIRSRIRRACGLGEVGRAAFSQEGEDLILSKLFGVEEGRATPGFYVDVGAHHPERYSNTCFFYLRGWRGINIDPAPGTLALFNRNRPRDINLELAISDADDELIYTEFNSPALNGFGGDLARSRDGRHGHYVTGTRRIKPRRLADVLDHHLPRGTRIDFLTIDVEGHDLAVLRSNDWNRYRPGVVLAEDVVVSDLEGMARSEVGAFMASVGYTAVAKSVLTLIFADPSRISRSELGTRVN